jgi:hypothetical protein
LKAIDFLTQSTQSPFIAKLAKSIAVSWVGAAAFLASNTRIALVTEMVKIHASIQCGRVKSPIANYQMRCFAMVFALLACFAF